VLILPGNNYVVLGTKEGSLMLYDIQSAEIIYTEEKNAHQKEIWELAMHTNPQVADARGNLMIASASSDKHIKFWTLA